MTSAREKPDFQTGLVSVITPTYNRADFLPQAIQSVFDQTYKDFELIIVDDGSTDNTQEILQSFLSDSRVRYVHQPNQGQSVARSLAYSLSRGELVAFLDSDDWWAPEKLRRSMEVFQSRPNVVLVYADTITVDEGGNEVSRKNMRPFDGKVTAKLLWDNFVTASSAVVRRRCIEAIGGIQSRFKIADDYDLWLRVSTEGDFLHIPEPLVYYRMMPNQISSDKTARLETNENIIREFLADYPQVLRRAEIRDGWSFFYNRRGRYFAESGMFKPALKDFLRSLSWKPWSIRPWRSMAAAAGSKLRVSTASDQSMKNE